MSALGTEQASRAIPKVGRYALYSVEKLGSESNLVYLGEISRVRDASF